jgi:hypothetical protein
MACSFSIRESLLQEEWRVEKSRVTFLFDVHKGSKLYPITNLPDNTTVVGLS